MAQNCLTGKLIVILATFAAVQLMVQACQQPQTGVYLMSRNAPGDILLTMESDESSIWRVKNDIGPLTRTVGSFQMIRDGPLWNLVVTDPASLEFNEDGRPTSFTLEIECISPEQEFHVYSIEVSAHDNMKEINLVVPEDIQVESVVYRAEPSLSATYNEHHVQPYKTQADRFFDFDEQTGSLVVTNQLDYEKGPNVMWLFTTKRTSILEIRLFRIEITNANDNAPEFHLNKECVVEEDCKVKQYRFILDHNGKLLPKNGNKIFAVDADGDDVTYEVVEEQPEQDFITVDSKTGDLEAQAPGSDHDISLYVITVQASDGLHNTQIEVFVRVQSIGTLDILNHLGSVGTRVNPANANPTSNRDPDAHFLNIGHGDKADTKSPGPAEPDRSQTNGDLDNLKPTDPRSPNMGNDDDDDDEAYTMDPGPGPAESVQFQTNSILDQNNPWSESSRSGFVPIFGDDNDTVVENNSEDAVVENSSIPLMGNESNGWDSWNKTVMELWPQVRDGDPEFDLYLQELCRNFTTPEKAENNETVRMFQGWNGTVIGEEEAEKLCSQRPAVRLVKKDGNDDPSTTNSAESRDCSSLKILLVQMVMLVCARFLLIEGMRL